MNTESSVNPPDRLDRILAWLSAIPVALIVILTFVDVLGRYVFSAPLRGSMEIIEFAMALVIFTALPSITRHRGHVSVSLIDGLFKGTAQRVKEMLCDAISAVALGLLTWRLGVQAMEDWRAGGSSVVLNLPHAPLSMALTFFAALSTLTVLGLIVRNINAQGAPT